MNNRFERQFAERMKSNYEPGTRLELISMDDPYSKIPPGTRGTVMCVDDIGTIHVKWDNGSGLGLVPGEDAFRRLTPAEIEEETNSVVEQDSFARSPKKAIKEAREIIAKCIGATPEEIIFTSGGTESDNWAIKCVDGMTVDRKTIITSEIEHHAVLNACRSMELSGTPVAYLPANKCGRVLPETLTNYITTGTRLVSVMFSNNEVGTIQPVQELCEIAHQYGALFHTDAVQAIGHIPIDVKATGVDLLSASAHKFNGPKGIGFLYIKKGTPIKAYHNGGSQEFGLRSGTENVASIVAMAVALMKNCEHMQENQRYIAELENQLIQGLDGVDYLGSSIFNMLGIPAQQTLLGVFTVGGKEKVVCACGDFTSDGKTLYDFCSIKNTVIDSEHGGSGTELSNILESIEKQQFVNPGKLLEHFWNVFVADALLGNFDRHNGNWGFLYNSQTDTAEIAPIFDCGSCLLPQADEKVMRSVLANEDDLNARIYRFPTSAIKMSGQKINYYDFLMSGEYADCNEAIVRIVPKIDMEQIEQFIDGTPYISDLQKHFYKAYINARYEKIMLPAFEQATGESLTKYNSSQGFSQSF